MESSRQLRGASTSGRSQQHCAGVRRQRAVPGRRVLVVARATTREARKETLLCQRLKAHDKAVSAALILSDEDNKKELVTAGLDKTMAFWRMEESCDSDFECAPVSQVVRLVPSGSPIFSFVKDGWTSSLDNRKQVFCGNMGREVLAWEPGDANVQETVVLDGHSGWVRALAKHNKWLLSASCNVLRQYDMTRAIPRLVREVALDKGDILGLATGSDRVFTAGADGSLHSWVINKAGELVDAQSRPRAHKDRVAGVRYHSGLLYTASYDGSVKAWDAESLELVMEVPKAHDGERVTCAAVGANGSLYTGGDDKLIRRWSLQELAPGEPLYCHNHSLRTLNAGKSELLVSGDAGGELAVWKL